MKSAEGAVDENQERELARPENICPNIIGGAARNLVAPGVYGATISGGGSAVEGANRNRVWDNHGTIGGGHGNGAGHDEGDPTEAEFATVGGGYDNFAIAECSVVAGGRGNETHLRYAAIGGGQGNDGFAEFATIGGGGWNRIWGRYGTIAGGGVYLTGDQAFANFVFDDGGSVGRPLAWFS